MYHQAVSGNDGHSHAFDQHLHEHTDKLVMNTRSINPEDFFP